MFHDESDIDWIRASAAGIGRILSADQASALAHMLSGAADYPEVVAARASADCSAELHRADLRRHFAFYGLDQFVDAYTLSFEHGMQKPDPKLLHIALRALETKAENTLMVGDNARRDGGASAVGITTLVLSPAHNAQPRGLELVLRLIDDR